MEPIAETVVLPDGCRVIRLRYNNWAWQKREALFAVVRRHRLQVDQLSRIIVEDEKTANRFVDEINDEYDKSQGI